MSVLIKDLNVPLTCSMCDFVTEETGECMARGGEPISEDMYLDNGWIDLDKKDKDCPLIEVHIDCTGCKWAFYASAICEKCKQWYDDRWEEDV